MTVNGNIQLSIIIVNWNTVDLLDNCLASLKKYLPNSLSIEIIVVDNNSSDSSVEMVRAKYPEVLLLDKHENLGFVKANNEGYRVASGKYILLLNSDTIILDSGTTTACIARNLKKLNLNNVTVITNDLIIGKELCPSPGIKVVVAGGMLRTSYYAAYGHFTAHFLKNLKAFQAWF